MKALAKRACKRTWQGDVRTFLAITLLHVSTAAVAREPYDPDRYRPPGSSSIDVRIPLRYVQPLPEDRVSPDPDDHPVTREWGKRPAGGPPKLYLQEPSLGEGPPAR